MEFNFVVLGGLRVEEIGARHMVVICGLKSPCCHPPLPLLLSHAAVSSELQVVWLGSPARVLVIVL